MKKNTVLFLMLLLTVSINAQKIKVKKGNILVDKVKFGTIEKLKNKKDGRYAIVKNNNGEDIFKTMMLHEKSKIYDKKIVSYPAIICIQEKDTFAIDDTFFYIGEKKISKYLVKNRLLNENGVNKENLTNHLAEVNSKGKYALELINDEKYLIENSKYIVDRDTEAEVFIEKMLYPFSLRSKPDRKTRSESFYAIYQGTDEENRNLIGYAITEISNTHIDHVIITNSKKVPIAYFDNLNRITLFPYHDNRDLKKRLDLSKVIPSIYSFAYDLIKDNKI